MTGRDIDWEQTLASLPVDFVFSLVSSGWSGDGDLPDVNKRVIEPETYIHHETGDAITVFKGKSLADVDAEAARFYEGAATAIEIDKKKIAEDLFLEYSDSLGVDDIPPLAEFKMMFNDGGVAWSDLTLKKQWKDAISNEQISRFTRLEDYKASSDYVRNNAPELAASYGGDIDAAVNDVTNKVFETGKPVGDDVEEIKTRLQGYIDDSKQDVVKYNKINGIKDLGDGSFEIIKWDGYPGDRKPDGPFRVLEGDEYNVARKLANITNKDLHKQNSSYDGMQIHEVHPGRQLFCRQFAKLR